MSLQNSRSQRPYWAHPHSRASQSREPSRSGRGLRSPLHRAAWSLGAVRETVVGVDSGASTSGPVVSGVCAAGVTCGAGLDVLGFVDFDPSESVASTQDIASKWSSEWRRHNIGGGDSKRRRLWAESSQLADAGGPTSVHFPVNAP